MAWKIAAALLLLQILVKGDDAFDALPSSVVVHGRQGRNSNINGVYIRDRSTSTSQPCFRRPDYAGGQAIFLYFEGEWRLGRSPEHGSVWAYARSMAPSPLLIDVPWEVWDGQQVVHDPHLRVSDLSLVPQVLELSFGPGSPSELHQVAGVLMQQPGLWDGRPYYKHTAFQELFLLCSAEGWRLGPLPLALGPQGPGVRAPVLLSRSPAALPQEIVEPWTFLGRGMSQLPPGSVRLRPMDGAPAPWMAPQTHPQHLVIEGVVAGEGAANGVYRLATEPLNHQPVYHKTDAVRSASLWFAAGDWRFGPSIEDGTVWAYATSDVLSGDANWRSFDGQAQEVHIRDARMAIPEKLTISGTEFLQEKRLCDARPVFGATLGSNDTGHGGHGGGHGTNGSPATSRVFLYFRAHQSEWWLGPEVGGTEFVARATGSLFQVIPRIEELRWRVQVQAEPDTWKSDDEAGKTDLDLETVTVPSWSRLLCSFALAISGILLWSFRGSLGGGKKGRGLNPSKSETELACVVCLEAPRQILLMPCRHVCCCKDCAERLERCPICRTETKSLAEVFL